MTTTFNKPLAFALFLAVLLAPAIADAHVDLLRTTPAANADMETSPREIELTFSEAVSIESRDAVVLVRPNGTSVRCVGRASIERNDKSRVLCRLPNALARGVYTVYWLVASDDTHAVHGQFSFGIRAAVRETLGLRSYPYDPSGVLANVFRWLSLLGTALTVGALAFEAIVLRRDTFPEGSRAAVEALSRSGVTLRRVGLVTATVGSIVALDIQTAAATGTDAFGAVALLGPQIVGSTWGLAWIARMFSLAGIAILNWRGRASPISLALGGLLMLSFSQSGHAVVSVAAIAADWVHLAGASLWLGGLAVFALGIRRAALGLCATEVTVFRRSIIARFSAVAIPAVVALVLAGVYGSAVHFVSLPTLLKTAYSRIILSKALLLIPLLVLGYYHYRQGRGAASRGFVLTVRCEAALIVAILVLSAILTGLPPPNPLGGHE